VTWFSTDPAWVAYRFYFKDIKKPALIHHNGWKLVLDPNIVLFKELQNLYDAQTAKFLQVIYYTHSTEQDNPLLDWMTGFRRKYTASCVHKSS
jgi:hypothetical protein